MRLVDKYNESNLLPIEFIGYQKQLKHDDSNLYPFIDHESNLNIIQYVTGICDKDILEKIADDMFLLQFYKPKIECYREFMKLYNKEG